MLDHAASFGKNFVAEVNHPVLGAGFPSALAIIAGDDDDVGTNLTAGSTRCFLADPEYAAGFIHGAHLPDDEAVDVDAPAIVENWRTRPS